MRVYEKIISCIIIFSVLCGLNPNLHAVCSKDQAVKKSIEYMKNVGWWKWEYEYGEKIVAERNDITYVFFISLEDVIITEQEKKIYDKGVWTELNTDKCVVMDYGYGRFNLGGKIADLSNEAKEEIFSNCLDAIVENNLWDEDKLYELTCDIYYSIVNPGIWNVHIYPDINKTCSAYIDSGMTAHVDKKNKEVLIVKSKMGSWDYKAYESIISDIRPEADEYLKENEIKPNDLATFIDKKNQQWLLEYCFYPEIDIAFQKLDYITGYNSSFDSIWFEITLNKEGKIIKTPDEKTIERTKNALKHYKDGEAVKSAFRQSMDYIIDNYPNAFSKKYNVYFSETDSDWIVKYNVADDLSEKFKINGSTVKISSENQDTIFEFEINKKNYNISNFNSKYKGHIQDYIDLKNDEELIKKLFRIAKLKAEKGIPNLKEYFAKINVDEDKWSITVTEKDPIDRKELELETEKIYLEEDYLALRSYSVDISKSDLNILDEKTGIEKICKYKLEKKNLGSDHTKSLK